MIPPELVLMATDIGNITSRAVLGGRLAEAGEGRGEVIIESIAKIAITALILNWAWGFTSGRFFNNDRD